MSVFKTMGVIGRLKDAAKVISGSAEAVEPGTGKALVDLAKQTIAPDAQLEALRLERDTLRFDRDKHKRRADEFFAILERILAQRDTWQNMWRIHVSEHQNAQYALEAALVRTRDMLGKTIAIVNEYRTRDGQPLLQRPSDLDGVAPPIGTAKAFEEKMKAIEADPAEAIANIPHKEARELSTKVGLTPVDGKAEMERIATAARAAGEEADRCSDHNEGRGLRRFADLLEEKK